MDSRKIVLQETSVIAIGEAICCPLMLLAFYLCGAFDRTVVIGGIEASQRRLTHYDYWDDTLHPSILVDTKADFLTYGMAERAMVALAKGMQEGKKTEELQQIPQIAYLTNDVNAPVDIELASHQACLASKKVQAQNFKIFV